MITVALEGDTDEPFVRALCEGSGFQVRSPLVGREGKGALPGFIKGFARAGFGAPHLVVRDLDQDAPCAPSWVARNRPQSAGEFFSLRVAVRAVEAWFLADRYCAARALGIRESLLPTSPDDEPDPKLTIVNLARKHAKPRLVRALVPEVGKVRKIGPGFSAWLLGAAEQWSLSRAVAYSPSLARAHQRLLDLKQRWAAHADEAHR
jgi:hypothetical protein